MYINRYLYITSLSVMGMIIFCFSPSAKAFDCFSGANKITVDVPPTVLYADIDPVDLNKNVTDVLLTDMSAYASCKGKADSYYQNALRSTSLTISNSLMILGYSSYIISGGVNSASPPDVCIWPDSSCSMNGTTSAPVNAKIHLQRSASSGDWHVGTVLPAGSEIARMEAEARDVGSKYINAPWHSITWVFRLKSDMTIPAYTCSITQFDENVVLPKVSRSDMLLKGEGRFSKVKKEFKFNLACATQTSVSVAFEGTPLSGTNDVLKNSAPGNDNIGVQMTFSDDTPVKLGSIYPITSSAQSSELLKFNAYYYYSGGSVTVGPVKANTTFTFNYQ